MTGFYGPWKMTQDWVRLWGLDFETFEVYLTPGFGSFTIAVGLEGATAWVAGGVQGSRVE